MRGYALNNSFPTEHTDRHGNRTKSFLLCSCLGMIMFAYSSVILSHVCHVEKGRAWVSDPAAARSENVALPFLFAWFALFDAKKVTSQFIPRTPGGELVYNSPFFACIFNAQSTPYVTITKLQSGSTQSCPPPRTTFVRE